MRALAALLLLVVSAAGLSAQPAGNTLSPDTSAALRALQKAALSSDYAYTQLAHLTDSIGPRLSGSPGDAAAVEYVAAELRRLGLDVHLEEVTVPHWVRGEERAELVGYPGQPDGVTQRLVLSALGGSTATPADGLTAEVVAVPDFDALRRRGRDDVAGRIVVFTAPFDERLAEAGHAEEAYGRAVAYRSGGPAAAARLGAVACLVRSAGGANYRLPHTGGTDFPKDVEPIPAGALAAEDAALVERLARQGPVRMHLVLTPRTLPDLASYNVIGDIKGSEHPEQVVIVSGHLDSWDLATGAIDDAGGVAVAMEAAHLVRELGLRPTRTIRIVAWAAEEPGLLGARAYAKRHSAEAANHAGAIEADLGVAHPLGIEIGGDASIAATLAPVASVLGASGAGVLHASELAGSDIITLGILGVPTFAPIQDSRHYFDYHHTPADTLDKVKPEELRENAALAAVLAVRARRAARAAAARRAPRTRVDEVRG